MTCWTNCVIRKIEPNVPKYMKNDTAFVTANARWRKRSTGSIGCAARRSQTTNAASSAAPGEAAHDRRAAPPLGLAADEPEDEAEQPRGDEREPGTVGPPRRAV